MGILATGKYTGSMINKFSGQFLQALDVAATRTDQGSADAACTRWFGDNTAAFKKDTAKKLRKMKSVVNLKTIRISFQSIAARERGENAAAWNDQTAHFGLGTGDFSHVRAHHGITSEVYLNEGFRQLPDFLGTLGGGTIDDTFWNQSKFETIIHEMSHLILGTIDAVHAGTTAYGAQRAATLAAGDAAKAKRNAENWAIFVEAVGINKSS